MKNNNEKGFALVLSLLLLLVMSLMGGALIVISSGDHQSNNSSDQYQQAFYVAETALIEGEKEIINKMMGPWTKTSALGSLDPDVLAFITSMAVGGMVRNTENANLPLNRENGDDGNPILNKDSECFKSFRNIDRDNFLATIHIEKQHFYGLIKQILDDESNIIDTLEGTDDIAKKKDAEIFQLKRFYFEYFSTYIGVAEFKAAGSSLKKTSTNAQTQGHVYKIYGCGIMKGGSGDANDEEPFKDGDNDIIIPLETVIIVS
tara:strand:+ start:201 stop:983 length:783 start_codon:yes stop_codon:yes gene_type:complete